MQTSTFESVARITALNSVRAYQKYISPKKGFSCPHRILHGGESCSDYVKRMLTHQSLVSAVQSSFYRFSDCATASQTLQSRSTSAGFRCIVIPCCLPL